MTSKDTSSLHSQHRSKRRMFRTKTFRLLSMLSLTFAFFIIELVVGNITNSVALVADAFHMLSDVISLVIAVVAVRISRRQSNVNTYGWVRAEVVGANINTVFLLALCLTIIFDAIKRFFQPESIKNVNLLLIVGSIGLGINIIGLFLFQGFHGHSHGGSSHGHSHGKSSHGHSHKEKSHGHSHDEKSHGHSHNPIEKHFSENIDIESLGEHNKFERHSTRALQEAIAECAQHSNEQMETVIEVDDEKESKPKKQASMNMHGVFLHVLADALGSVVVIISALVIKFVPHDPESTRHWTVYIDPTLSIIIVIIITISTIPLFKDTCYILLQTIPKHLEINEIKSQLLKNIPEIYGIHELHVWRLTDEKIIASAHLNRLNLSNYMLVADKVKKFFHSIGIHSVTIQYECDNDTKLNYQQTMIIEQTNSDDDEKKIAGDCLLRCENAECDTQTCCTKVSDRTNILINNNGTTQIYSINQLNCFDNPIFPQVSTDPSSGEERL
ncbi:unnamed protein product [Adineta steineri]|uniref:Uncharacterized protein n=1 Tax=Adineta steineri TaxID=433720 RepID=A0A813RQE0_9BILA|nr:unnamed protein product [Adineta steineri]CAF1052373.1 unnamed protein product [Adineta steineri]